MSRQEKNSCRARGCGGACCMDIVLEDLNDSEVAVITKNARNIVEVPDVMESAYRVRVKINRGYRDPNNLPQTTLYISKKLNMSAILLDGPCPNLQSDGSCGVYATRPRICRNFPVDSDPCVKLARATSPVGGSVFIGAIQSRPTP